MYNNLQFRYQVRIHYKKNMEKFSITSNKRLVKSKLPNLHHSKLNLLQNHPNPSKNEALSSTQRFKDLRKLYFQYKSNANILQNSPYIINRNQQRQLVAYINANRYDIDKNVIEQINKKFPMVALPSNETTQKSIKIKLLALQNTFDFTLKAQNVLQMQNYLKRQFALQEYKVYGNTKKAQAIIGFESVNGTTSESYLLSIKNLPLFKEKYTLKPIFKENASPKVTLSDFKIVKCLGSGGFSLVFLVRDRWKGQYYALKLIDKKFILDSQRESIVENERFILGELKSDFVTKLKFCFETKNHFAFIIQYCPGGELFYQLKKVKIMTEEQAKFYFLEILIGLDFIHQKNIVYRDLKPENLLIGIDGHVKIADFGLAKPLFNEERKVAYSFCGSPQYMAPEMLTKAGHSFTLDYYCLGALLYELVVGIPPYYSLDHQQIYESILNEELMFPDHVQLSNEIKSLLRGLLEKNVSQRLGSMYGIKQILIHPWVGRVNRKLIEQKGLKPPFMPNLQQFNFDESEVKDKKDEILEKIKEDILQNNFETHFNDDFYFQDGECVKRQSIKIPLKLLKSTRRLKSKQNKQNLRINFSMQQRPKKSKRIVSTKCLRKIYQ